MNFGSRFDLHAKAIDGARTKSLLGGVVTLASCLVMFLLFCTELRAYGERSVKNRLYVDPSRGKRQIPINLNISFPALTCEEVHLDIEDQKGSRMLNVDQQHTMHKTPIVDAALPNGPDGCNIEGVLLVNKVAGSFHVTVGKNAIMQGHIR